jgi:hypothetical protein
VITGKTPDLTLAQLIAILATITAPLIARFGFDVDQSTLRDVIGLVVGVGGALILGDSHVRHGRARGALRGELDDAPASSRPTSSREGAL